jgi:restriction system protein
MGRRKSRSADGFIEIVSWLPWWVGVLLAMVVWVLFELFSPSPQSMANLKPGQMSGFVVNSLAVQLAPMAKYAISFLCLLGALVSFMGRRKRQALLHEAQGATGASAVHGMDWHEFEMLVGEAFRQHGYTVTETGSSGPDGGVDLVLTKGGERFLVQCKQWRALKVGVSVVREHYGVMAAQGAAGGFVVTSGRFTEEAEAFSSGRHIYLIDGPQLQEMIRIGRIHAPTPAPAQMTPQEVSPGCPLCQAPMLTRTAKKGANAGSQFWGCSRYPDCRGTRQA